MAAFINPPEAQPPSSSAVNTVSITDPTLEVVSGVVSPSLGLETTLPDLEPRSWNATFSDKLLSFFGFGQYASRARKSLVSMLWNLAWGIAQVNLFSITDVIFFGFTKIVDFI
jgi:hypothetical protein